MRYVATKKASAYTLSVWWNWFSTCSMFLKNTPEKLQDAVDFSKPFFSRFQSYNRKSMWSLASSTNDTVVFVIILTIRLFNLNSLTFHLQSALTIFFLFWDTKCYGIEQLGECSIHTYDEKRLDCQSEVKSTPVTTKTRVKCTLQQPSIQHQQTRDVRQKTCERNDAYSSIFHPTGFTYQAGIRFIFTLRVSHICLLLEFVCFSWHRAANSRSGLLLRKS